MKRGGSDAPGNAALATGRELIGLLDDSEPMTALPTVFFGAGVLAAGGIAVSVLASITQWMQVWPPGDVTWKAALHWSLVGVVEVCLLALAFVR